MDEATQAFERVKKKMGPTEMARRLSAHGRTITSQAISQWAKIPAERALEIEEATGIPRHELRPDLWPRNGDAAA